MTTPAVLTLLLIGAMGGFVVGWVAKRDDARKYWESRQHHLARQLAEALDDRDRVTAQRITDPQPTAPALYLLARVTRHLTLPTTNECRRFRRLFADVGRTVPRSPIDLG